MKFLNRLKMSLASVVVSALRLSPLRVVDHHPLEFNRYEVGAKTVHVVRFYHGFFRPKYFFFGPNVLVHGPTAEDQRNLKQYLTRLKGRATLLGEGIMPDVTDFVKLVGGIKNSYNAIFPNVEEVHSSVLPLEPVSSFHSPETLLYSELSEENKQSLKRVKKFVKKRVQQRFGFLNSFELEDRNFIKDSNYLRSLIFLDTLEHHLQGDSMHFVLFMGEGHDYQFGRLLKDSSGAKGFAKHARKTIAKLFTKNAELNRKITNFFKP